MDASPNRRTANLLLAVILLLTALVWIRACRIEYVSDDYLLELHSFAPIASARDVAERFTTPAVNLRYWRPVPDGLAVADFLLWGWDGRGFHLTNLIIHVLAAFFAFLVVRDVFGRPVRQALAVTLLFGTAASHEANILWPPGRADSLAALFVFAALVSERYAQGGGARRRWKAAGVASFLLALGSKEIAVAALVPLLLVPGEGTAASPSGTGRRYRWSVRRRFAALLPYAAAAALFFLYRSRLVEPMSGAPIFAGPHSPGALAMNAVYAVGYTILPLDLSQALSLLDERRALLVASALIACASIAVFCLYAIITGRWRSYLLPLAYTAAAGSFAVFSFERWRVYAMSLGVLTLLVMAAVDLAAPLKRKAGRTVLVLAASAWMLFNVVRALSAETQWLRASELRRELQADLGRVLEEYTARPVTFLFLDRPAKLGSAPLLQLAIRDVLTQARLERSDSPMLGTGGMRDMTVDHESAALLLALDAKRGFEGLRWRRVDRATYEFWVEGNPGLAIVPAAAKAAGRAGRDQAYAKGDTLRTPFADVILLDAKRTSARRAIVAIRDTTMVPLIFDGKRFTVQAGGPAPPPRDEARGD